MNNFFISRQHNVLFLATLHLSFYFIVRCGISISKFTIPSHVYISQNITLKCEFDLDGYALYSVKWYKDNDEIYRFIPSHQPSIKYFNSEGVIVDVNKSSPESIVLVGADKATSGIYACEVSGDSAHFPTKYIEKEMHVLEVPKYGPEITGIRTNYGIGDTVILNCTGPLSMKPTKLSWWINNRKVGSRFLIKYPPYNYNNGSQESKMGLKFTLRSNNIRSGLVRVRCKAVIASLYANYSSKILLVRQDQSTVPLQNKVIRDENQDWEPKLWEDYSDDADADESKSLSSTMTSSSRAEVVLATCLVSLAARRKLST